MAAGDLTLSMGTPVCWANSGTYNGWVGIDRTHQITLGGLTDGDMWQGEKADLGATRAPGYAVKVCVETTGAPTAGKFVEYYWSSSYSSIAATGNDGGAESIGTDADWDGIASGSETERDEYKRHLTFIGVLSVGGDANIPMVGMINSYFVPPARYGFPIVKNDLAQTLKTAETTMFIALIPVTENVAQS